MDLSAGRTVHWREMIFRRLILIGPAMNLQPRRRTGEHECSHPTNVGGYGRIGFDAEQFKNLNMSAVMAPSKTLNKKNKCRIFESGIVDILQFSVRSFAASNNCF